MSPGSTNISSFHAVVICKHRHVWIHGHMHSACAWLVHAVPVTIMKLHINGIRRMMTPSYDWRLCGLMITTGNCRYTHAALWFVHSSAIYGYCIGGWWCCNRQHCGLPTQVCQYSNRKHTQCRGETQWHVTRSVYGTWSPRIFGIYDVWVTSLVLASYCMNLFTVKHHRQKQRLKPVMCQHR